MEKTIVIVDDHILIAKAISGMIERYQNYKVLYEVANGKELKEKFRIDKNIPNIVLLDINMPVMNGYETANWLRTLYPEILIMTLSMLDDDMSLIKMVKNGANGYLLKNIHPVELERALNQLVKKGYYYPEWAVGKVFFSSINQMDSEEAYLLEKHGQSLSEKEIDFLQFCCTEMSYKQIADKMNVSFRTVDGYRDSLFAKLNIKTRIGLVLYAIKVGKYVV